MRSLLILLGLLIPTLAAAQSALPPAIGQLKANPSAAQSAIATASQQLAPRTNLLPWKPWSGSLQLINPTNYFGYTGGHDALAIIEAPDDFDAIELVFGNAGSSAWGVKQAVISPVASYGAGIYGTSGITPLDQFGNTIPAMLPVSFNGNCAPNVSQTAFAGSPSYYLGTAYLALAASAAASSGATSLTFSSTVTSNATGGVQPTVGMYVSDGLGGIPAGTKVASVGTTTIGLTGGAVTATGIQVGQAIFFTPTQPVLGVTVPASTNAPARSKCFSDLIPASSLPRTDGGVVAGMSMTGSGLASGTTASTISPRSVALSTPTTGTVAPGTAVTFAETPTSAATVVAGQYFIQLSSLAGVQVGQTIVDATASGAIASNTLVVQVIAATSTVQISNPTSAQVSTGDTLQLTNTLYTINSATLAIGQTSLPFASTSNRRLLAIRMLATDGTTPWVYYHGLEQVTDEQDAGLQEVSRSFIGGQTGGNATDGINFPATLGNNAGSTGLTPYMLPYAVVFQTRHRGVVIMGVGDSHYAGNTTMSGDAPYGRYTATALSTPRTPVVYLNEAIPGYNGNYYIPNALPWLSAIQPGLVLMQGWTHNGGDWLGSYTAKIMGLASATIAYGGRPIVGLEEPHQVRAVYQWATSVAVVNSTTIPLNSYIDGLLVQGTPFGIYGPGIPAGTTATVPDQYSNYMVASTPLTLPKGSLVSTSALVVASATTNSTSVPFTEPVGFNNNGYNISVSGCAATMITNSAGASSGTLNAACSLAAGTVVQVYNLDGTLPIALAANALDLTLAGGAMSVFDAFAPMQNPSDLTWFQPSYSLDGIHASDAGQVAAGAAFTSFLSPIIGN